MNRKRAYLPNINPTKSLFVLWLDWLGPYAHPWMSHHDPDVGICWLAWPGSYSTAGATVGSAWEWDKEGVSSQKENWGGVTGRGTGCWAKKNSKYSLYFHYNNQRHHHENSWLLYMQQWNPDIMKGVHGRYSVSSVPLSCLGPDTLASLLHHQACFHHPSLVLMLPSARNPLSQSMHKGSLSLWLKYHFIKEVFLDSLKKRACSCYQVYTRSWQSMACGPRHTTTTAWFCK